MLLDWFTVVAQIINFLILLALLKYFLYGRILHAIDERKRRIQEQFEEAENRQKEAEQRKEDYERKRKELDERHEEIIAQAREDAEVEHKRLVRQAREEVEELSSQWKNSLRRERESFLNDLQKRTVEQVFHISQRAMRDLASVNLERGVIDTFLDQIRSLSNQEKENLRDSLRSNGKTARVISSFEIPGEDQERIRNQLHDHISSEMEVEYRTERDLILGIELVTQDRKVSWNLERYLDTMREQTEQILKKGTERPEEDVVELAEKERD